MKIANKDARVYVHAKSEFTGSNLSACWQENDGDSWYVVYSYKYWPLFIYSNGVWYENDERISVTTSRHRSQCHPHVDTIKLDKHEAEKIATHGPIAVTRMKVLGQ